MKFCKNNIKGVLYLHKYTNQNLIDFFKNIGMDYIPTRFKHKLYCC